MSLWSYGNWFVQFNMEIYILGHLYKKDLRYVVDNQTEFSLYGVICFQIRSKVQMLHESYKIVYEL